MLILAQSAKAAKNVKGITIQSAFTIGLDTSKIKSISNKQKADKIKQLKDIEYICIDEISLVNKGLFAYIDYRLRELKENRIPFGNVNIIILGDWAQLFPVKAEKNPLFMYNK